MQFIPQLKNFLKDNGSIYTVRGYNMDHRWVKVEGVGWCERFPLGPIRDFTELDPFYDESGFKTLDDWIRMIRVFVREGNPTWLYRVEVKEYE